MSKLSPNNNNNLKLSAKKNPYKRAIARGAKQLAKAAIDKMAVPIKAKTASARAANAIVHPSSAPATTSFKFRAPVPTYIGVKNGIRIRHTEYVQDMQSSGTTKAYLASKFVLNPADSDTFPWLSDQATSYATYRFHSLSFRMGSLVSTATDGMYGLCATPDISDSVPTNKTNFMQYEHAVRNNVWQPATYTVPQDVLRRLPEYLTSVAGAASTDSTKQMGALFICSQGLVGTAVDYGELYVTYDVELIHPQSPNADAAHFASEALSSGNVWSNLSVQAGSTIRIARRSRHEATSSTTVQVQSAGDFLVAAHFTAASNLVNPSFAAEDNFGNPITITSLANIANSAGTSGINFFAVSNAPKPWYLVASGGTYGTDPEAVGAANVYLSRNYNQETESVSGIAELTKRLDKLERFVEQTDIDDEIYHEVVPKPPCTPVVGKVFSFKR